MPGVRLTHIGGPTVLAEVAGWRLLVDPTFDPPGRRYSFGWGTASRKIAGPAIAAEDIGPIDAVLLSHDHHADNLDDAGRALLPSAGSIVTTTSGRTRLMRNGLRDVRGLGPWETTTLAAEGRPSLTVTATPCRHGPPFSHPIIGDVIGFAVTPEGADRALWVSGDTVLYDGVRQVAERIPVDVALLHLGGVQFGITGPIRYSMTGADAVELLGLLRPRVAVPVHFEGWSHFREPESHLHQALQNAPEPVRSSIHWLTPGTPTTV